MWKFIWLPIYFIIFFCEKWTKYDSLNIEGRAIIRNYVFVKNTAIFFSKKFFWKNISPFFLLQNLVTFWGQHKMFLDKKNIFLIFQKIIFENFLEKFVFACFHEGVNYYGISGIQIYMCIFYRRQLRDNAKFYWQWAFNFHKEKNEIQFLKKSQSFARWKKSWQLKNFTSANFKSQNF